MEKRYDLSQTIASIKANIATHFQTSEDGMRLDLQDLTGTTIETAMKDDKMLGYYQCKEDYTIHVVHVEPQTFVDYDDVSKVEKYVMSEEDYNKRTDSVRAYKARMKALQQEQGVEVADELNEDSFKEEAATIKVGDRCQCFPGDRLGTVKYVGRIVAIKPGFFVGVEFDEPVGKSDGSVKGVRVFECEPLYGGFLRPNQVTVGDFPPEEF